MVLLRLELGVVSRGCVGPVEVVCEHLRLGDVDKVYTPTSLSPFSSQPVYICSGSIL